MVQSIEIDWSRVQSVSLKINKVVRRKSRDPVEGLYALKASLYVMRCAMEHNGFKMNNEVEMDGFLMRMIDESIEDE